jgi:putative Mg2+ transporter-C (MgtC) family protein
MIYDPAASSRIVANIVTGIGFLGAGIIFRGPNGASRGLTTAATIWCTAAVGVAVGLNMFVIAIVATAVLYSLISLHHQRWYVSWKNKMARQHSEECEREISS